MKNLIPSWVRVPIVFFIILGLVEYFIESGSKPAFLEEPIIMLFLLLVLLILLAMEAIISTINNILYKSLDEEAKVRYVDNSKDSSKVIAWIKDTYNKHGKKQIQYAIEFF